MVVNSLPLRANPTLPSAVAAPVAGQRPVVWSIAGSDSGGGAGLQADLKALQAFGVHACTAVAALTAQNSQRVAQVMPVSAAQLDAQLAALADDMPPQAIKTGLLGSVENVRVVCQWVDRLRVAGHRLALVVDPVLKSSTGASFVDDALVQAYIFELLPRATVVTPNRSEAERLGLAAGQPYVAGQPAVVVTGGDDSVRSGLSLDWLSCAQVSGWLSLPRVDTPHHHGTGCTFASTVAAALASGYSVADACVLAKMATTHSLRHAYAAGQGAGPVNVQADFAQYAHNVPALWTQRAKPMAEAVPAFASLVQPVMGVYAVVDSVQWVRRVLAAGIRTVQLRIKDATDPSLPQQVADAVAAARAVTGAQLFINDHWQLALAHGAYGVHVGQEDLHQVDTEALRQAGVRLGVSTHSYWEVARAVALQPSYIACGPVFPTQTKDMPWLPQGLHNAAYWAGVLPTPVVAIAGIDQGNMAEVAATGVAGAALITAITRAEDPGLACQELMTAFAHGRGGV